MTSSSLLVRSRLGSEGRVLKIGSGDVLQLTKGLQSVFELLVQLHWTVNPERPIAELDNRAASPHVNPKPAKRALCCIDVVPCWP